MDRDTRNLIQRATLDARRLLEREYREQLEGTFDIMPNTGAIAPQPGAHLDARQQFIRSRIIIAIQHERAKCESATEAVQAYLREAAFTMLNRFAALKMMEARKIALECVSRGEQSGGFREFTGLAPGLGTLPDHGYRLYLECLFDEIGTELRVLFDRRDPASLLWPRRQALSDLLDVLNRPELATANVWIEDETIGWIYQYFNSKEEREAMRDPKQGGSAAPRNSRELAVRNQFFTPRYIVQFLADNTVGRIWYEMTQGNTKLKEVCCYLVRRPTEIFLKPGENAPEQPKQDNLSQEDLLKQPVQISHRPLKDPRTILMLDPACGSMHFGLYAFDLFEVIYEEYWDLVAAGQIPDHASRIADQALKPLTDLYPNKQSFLRDVPRLIIEHNLHGIDIDPRCAQIAGLSLWLRAQKAWQRLGLNPAERPAIKRSNIVCAEPMPGEKELLREFVEREFPAEERGVVLRLLEAIFDKMQLAGEAGSLLKIEEEIRSAIEDARRQWQTARQRPEFFDAAELAKLDKRAGAQQELPAAERAAMAADLRSLTSEDFWRRVEERIYAALRDYAEQAENSGGFQRRLFAEDAARGFAFIDVCRRRYDVVLMNPPFGLTQGKLYEYLNENYPVSFIDLLASFVVRVNALAPSGFLGAITSRACLYTTTLLDWRKAYLSGRVSALADLGIGVLDGAMVRACAYVIPIAEGLVSGYFVDARRVQAKDKCILAGLRGLSTGASGGLPVYWRDTAFFSLIPHHRILYWLPRHFWQRVKELRPIEPNGATIRAGLTTYDDERFLRLRWEVPPHLIALGDWVFISKGGYFGTFYNDVHLVVLWANGGKEVGAHNQALYETDAQSRRGSAYYFRPAATYSRRTDFFSARALPSNCFFTDKGPAIIPLGSASPTYLLGLFNSDLFRGLVHSQSQGGCFETGVLKVLPWIEPPASVKADIEQHALAAWKSKAAFFQSVELDASFCRPSSSSRVSFKEIRLNAVESICSANAASRSAGVAISTAVTGHFQLSTERFEDLDVFEDDHEIKEAKALVEDARELPHSMVSYALGCAFGRWDVRYATGEKAAPELPDPFAPLPVCPPGQLQNAQGLPLEEADSQMLKAEEYPIEIPWDGILVDDPNHPLDIERRVREVSEIIWPGSSRREEAQTSPVSVARNQSLTTSAATAESIELEVCETLGVKSLREYFRKGFFADHLKRYSKSRRQAPIYWPLSTASGNYTVWLYYHRFAKDTLYRVRELANDKLAFEERQLANLRQESGPNPSAGQRKQLAEKEAFVQELREFRTEIAQVAPLWNPDLNDGVIINFAPLWRLIAHRPWQKDVKECWEALRAGRYDWAHVAMHLWPERVVPQCQTDRSFAIAHGLDAVFWEEGDGGKWKAKKVPEVEVERLIVERISAAVKDALKSLLQAAVAGGAAKGRRRKG
jgi:hypothetical protein